jgi:hypothetical protein
MLASLERLFEDGKHLFGAAVREWLRLLRDVNVNTEGSRALRVLKTPKHNVRTIG